MTALHNRPGIRAHLRRFGIDTVARRRLRNAFAALVDYGPAIELALKETTQATGEVGRIQHAVRLLVDGPNGEFWS